MEAAVPSALMFMGKGTMILIQLNRRTKGKSVTDASSAGL